MPAVGDYAAMMYECSGMKPNFMHYFVASAWPTRIWVRGWSVGGAVYAGVKMVPVLGEPLHWLHVAGYVLLVVLGWLLGYYASLIVGWPILGPFYYGRSRLNGEPFRKGDLVLILCGPHKDKAFRVEDAWDYADYAGAHIVEVEAGGVKESFKSYQILRLEAAPPDTSTPPAPAEPKRALWWKRAP